MLKKKPSGKRQPGVYLQVRPKGLTRDYRETTQANAQKGTGTRYRQIASPTRTLNTRPHCPPDGM